jgi:hypothetical protein
MKKTTTDRRVGDGSRGLSEATLRIPVDHADYKGELLRAFGTLFPLYGRGYFFVSVTANVVLEGLDGRWSVFFGQDHSVVPRDFSVSGGYVIRRLGQVPGLPTSFDPGDFGHIFSRNFESTAVTVHSVICFVYVIRRYLRNFDAQQTTNGRLKTLY